MILIVEDNSDLRNYISRNLATQYNLVAAENGKQGMEQAVEEIPDLIISDVMMPEMDGMELCRQIKADEKTNHIPVILLTAKADRGSKMEGLETGADDYIIKPFDAEELQVRVRNLIEQRKRLRESFRREIVSETDLFNVPPGDPFQEKLMAIINRHIADPEFKMEDLAEKLHMSRSQVYRKTIATTDYPPTELIRNLRLRKAASLFRHDHTHVAQVMHQVGFNNQSYFGKCFSELYGVTPSEYISRGGNPDVQ